MSEAIDEGKEYKANKAEAKLIAIGYVYRHFEWVRPVIKKKLKLKLKPRSK